MTIFICSPLRGRDASEVARNRARAADYCRAVYDAGCVPLAPHVYLPQFLKVGDAAHERFAETFSQLWIRASDAVWVFDADGVSAGMAAEIAYAERCGVPVLYQSRGQLPESRKFAVDGGYHKMI